MGILNNQKTPEWGILWVEVQETKNLAPDGVMYG